jgi:HD-GYP domain-containing protein (c-di-GMP phosphodiesterase class II)
VVELSSVTRDELRDWSDVREWLVSCGEMHGELRVEHPRAVTIRRPRCTIAVVEIGGELPADLDVAMFVGSNADLGAMADRFHDRPVTVLPLPCARDVAERLLAETVRSAEAFAAARMADQLLEIGRSLNAERDPARVLDLILEHARRITRADAGSIYLVENDGKTLHFKASHNDSVAADFSEFTVEVRPTSIVGMTVLGKTTIRVEDLYAAAVSTSGEHRFVHDRSFDERFGYQTRSILTTPMITPEGKVLAVIQLINAKRGSGPLSHGEFETRVRPFTAQDEDLALALASQAATALENASLYAEIQGLFEGFVRASVYAIEQRDPTTSGHSQRVADFTVALAKVADRSDRPRFADVSFCADDLREIEYAGLLHDFGKVGVREEILVKAKKLYPHELELVRARFDHMRTSVQLRALEQALERHRMGRGDDANLNRDLEQRLLELDDAFEMVLQANEPTVLHQTVAMGLRHLDALSFRNSFGETIRVVSDADIDALSVRRGSLTAAERAEIQDHVTHTHDFLVRIPWGSSLARLPEIAAKHHEYLDGTGYPNALGEADIPLQARLMTVADIFDALTASDRPYKKAMPVDRALEILDMEAAQGKVDRDVLDLFIEGRVFEVRS